MPLIQNPYIFNSEFITLSFRGFSTKTNVPGILLPLGHSHGMPILSCPMPDSICNIAYLRATEGVFESLPGDSRAPCTKAHTLFVSINSTPWKPLQSNTLAGVVRRTLHLENSPHTPHSLRADCATSYKITYGVSNASVLQLGNWQSEMIPFNQLVTLSI